MTGLSWKWMRGFTVLLFLFSTPAFGLSDFQRKFKGQEKAHNDAFHADLLKQITESHSTSTNDSVSHFSSDLKLDSFVSFADNATNSLQIYTSDSLPTNPAPPNDCATAMTAVIPCNSTIPLMALNPYLFSNDLQIVCTTDCQVGLESYRAGVISACGNYMITDSSNNTYAPTLAVDYVSGPYVVQCLQDPGTGDFCGPIVQSYNTTNGLLTLPTNELCTFCTLETLNATLSNPTSYSVDLANLLSSAIGICGTNFDTYNVTSSPGDQVVLQTPFGVNSTSAPTIDCSASGRNITTTDATTCTNIASQYSVSEYDVFSSNPFLSADCNIVASTVLCVPQACTTYTIAINDTCQSVAQLAGIVPGTNLNVTAAQIQSFNPDLGTYCQLMPLRVGKSICLSPNGGWPTVGATSQGNPSATPTTVAPIPSPTVSGTTSACGRYYLVKAGDFCQTVAINNYVTLSDFFTLNPEINVNCTNLWTGYYYCVAAYPPLQTVTSAPLPTTNYTSATVFSYPIPTANYTITYTTSTITAAGVSAPTNIAAGTRSVACGGYYDIQAGDTLDSVANLVGVNTSLLATWNLELSDGSLPAVGSAICILFPMGNYTLPPASRPTNAYANATTACAQYYTVQSGDGCSSIEAQFGLSNSQLDQLNPGLASDCTNLILGVAYCVMPTVPFSASNNTGPPDNVAPGTITDGCLSYYTVVSGDTCSVIEDRFNITLTDITTWNPEINSGCTNIQLGLAYCVSFNTTTTGPPPPPANLATGSLNNCTTYYTVVSGDNCPAVETTYNISASDFFRWNPEVSFDCSNILVGEAYCVGGGGDACGKIYAVQSGDFCSAITQSQSITQQELDALNPFLDTNCDLSVGERLCVG
ncbi:hypothetical protein BYT27DRAFT_7154018 [Phlegmacium glaucopus]|nr:hypothetical protein BYT27DRAFT_7154018 [Phlegmacium glaucopus]